MRTSFSFAGISYKHDTSPVKYFAKIFTYIIEYCERGKQHEKPAISGGFAGILVLL